MPHVFFQAIPFDKKLVTLALESGVDGIVAEPERVEAIKALGRTEVLTPADFTRVEIAAKTDEETAARTLEQGGAVLLAEGWEIIPVENLLARGRSGLGLGCEARSAERARVAAGVLESGVDWITVLPEAAAELKDIVAGVKLSQGRLELDTATITAIEAVGVGHRVCVDTLSMLATGQGMLVGNSSAFTFLVNAETESNPYVAARPFRINAGAVHAYCQMPGDRTTYLEELGAGLEVLIVDHAGQTRIATVGRVKVEVRPMLLILAEVQGPQGPVSGAVFLQNAETIRVVRPGGEPVSVVSLDVGDEVLVRLDTAGRHFGMRIAEDIKEG